MRNRVSVIQAKFFRAPCRKSYALDQKMIVTFLMVSASSITVQSLGKIVQRMPAVGAKIQCLCVFYLSRSESGARFVLGCHTLKKYCVMVYGSILMQFSRFCSKAIAISDALEVLIFIDSWRHNFRKIVVKNYEKPKNRRKCLCAQLRIDSRGYFIKSPQ